MLCHGAGGTRRAVAPGGAGIIGLPGSNRSAVQVSGGTLELPCLDSPVASLANGASGLFDGEADRGRYARIRDGRASSGPDSSAGADLTARANDGHLPARPWQRGGGGLAGLASGARERARIARWGCQGGAGRLTAGPSRGETGTVGRAAKGQQERAEQAGIAESGIYSTPCLALARLALEGPAHGLGIGAGFGNDLGEDGRGDGLLRGGLHTTTVAPLSPTRKYNLSSCAAAPGGHTRPEGHPSYRAVSASCSDGCAGVPYLAVSSDHEAHLEFSASTFSPSVSACTRAASFQRPDRSLTRLLVAPGDIIQDDGYAVQPGLVSARQACLAQSRGHIPPSLRPTPPAGGNVRRPRARMQSNSVSQDAKSGSLARAWGSWYGSHRSHPPGSVNAAPTQVKAAFLCLEIQGRFPCELT